MKKFLLGTLLLGLGQAALAQAPTTTGPTPTPQAGPAAVPLDGGGSLLLVGGVAYGLRRLKKRCSPV